MALADLPRAPLGVFPTPLHRAPELGELLGIADLWIKRDDLSGFSWGGNKVRAAEFLLGDAHAVHATDLVVAGGPSSNFVAIMAAAGQAHGLAVHQVSYGSEPDRPVAALAATRSCGATVTFTGSSDRSTMEIVGLEMAAELTTGDRVGYPIPRGGGSSVGTLGFIAAAAELAGQLEGPATIVLPLGSGGSTAGLLAGAALGDHDWRLVGASVSRPADEIAMAVIDKAVGSATLTGTNLEASGIEPFLTVHDARGAGFGIARPEEHHIADDVNAATGLLIDATYNAKALRWLADTTDLDGPVVYWHTGGILGVIDQLGLTHIPEQIQT